MSGPKHDADCIRRKAETGWQYICTCRMTDAEVSDAVAKCDSCDELPPDLPFPNCKCFE